LEPRNFEHFPRNSEHGTWNLGTLNIFLGTLNTELGTFFPWNSEHGTWNIFSSERKANTYSLFVKATKVLKANVRAENADICGIEVTVNPAYKDPTKPCAAKFQEYKDRVLHNGDPVEGQTLTIGELFDAIAAVPELSNGMTRAGMLWGLIGEEAKTKMSEYGAAME